MKKLITICLLSFIVSLAGANPVYITNDPVLGQDGLKIKGYVEELGNNFPPDELISSREIVTYIRPCYQNPDDLQIPNFAVSITNLTGKRWWDLHYVADPETKLQNYDISRLNGQLAFRIDNVGLNTPLIYESMTNDLIFEPGETWTFVLQDYSNGFGLPASALGSLGVPSPGEYYLSSGSIIAIPEPATICLFAIGSSILIGRKK